MYLPRLCALKRTVTEVTGWDLLLLVLDCRIVLSHACIGVVRKHSSSALILC